MRDVYVLVKKAATYNLEARIVCIADDIERCNEEMSKHSAIDQSMMEIQNYDLLEDGD